MVLMISSYVAEPGPKSASGDASLSIEETKYVFGASAMLTI